MQTQSGGNECVWDQQIGPNKADRGGLSDHEIHVRRSLVRALRILTDHLHDFSMVSRKTIKST